MIPGVFVLVRDSDAFGGEDLPVFDRNGFARHTMINLHGSPGKRVCDCDILSVRRISHDDFNGGADFPDLIRAVIQTERFRGRGGDRGSHIL